MTRARILQEVRQMRFEELYARRQRRDVTMAEEAGGKVDKTRLTQVHRALQLLEVTLIPAYSPEARGRCLRWAPRRGARATCPAAWRVFFVQL